MRATRLIAALVLVGSCTSAPPPAATVSPSTAASATPAPTPAGLDHVPAVKVEGGLRWYTVPDGLVRTPYQIVVDMGGEAAAGEPRARLRETAMTVPLSFVPKTGSQWTASLDLAGLRPGEQTVDVLVRMRDGADRTVASTTFLLTQPVYVVWTLDFEGDAASDATLENTAALAKAHGVPMTLMWNPRVWTTRDVTAERAELMRLWAMGIVDAGAGEIALHLHAWTDFVRAAGVAPRTAPSWAGRGDGYDVPLTAFDEAETAKLLDHALRLMAEHAMPRPTSFRGGGLFANAANLRALAAAGFTVDASATPAGSFGNLQLPWTLPKDAQPYRPSRTDANVAGDLPLLEVPNIAGNTYGFTASSIQRIVNDDLAMLPRPGVVAAQRRVLTLVSHPATIDATERAAIDALFKALDAYRSDGDQGPLRYVTLSQLARALGN